MQSGPWMSWKDPFLTSFLVSPFHVASTCLMIQYIPLNDSPMKSLQQRLSNSSDGYLLPNQSLSTIPPYQVLPKKRSLYQMMRDLICLDTEGFGSLWKAFPSLYLYTLGDVILHSQLESLLLSEYDYNVSFRNFFLVSALKGWVLSIFQVTSTRMIAQTMHPKHKTYSSTLSCLMDLSWTTYFSRPCLLGSVEAGLECIFEGLGSLSFLYFGTMGRILVNTSLLLILCPIKVMRRRMELPRDPNSFPTVVQISKIPYPGILDTLWRILQEEGIGALYSTFSHRFWIMLTVEGLKSLNTLLDSHRLSV